MTDYAFCRGLEYPSIVAVSERVAWTVDAIFGDRRFDASKPLVPDSWLSTEHLAFLDDREQRTLNHIRAFSYVHLLGNYEEFIPIQKLADLMYEYGSEFMCSLSGRFSHEKYPDAPPIQICEMKCGS